MFGQTITVNIWLFIGLQFIRKIKKQGLARKLMDFAENIAIECGYASIRLDAYSGNERVLRFYENRGYQKRGEVNFSGRALPFFCYEKEISN